MPSFGDLTHWPLGSESSWHTELTTHSRLRAGMMFFHGRGTARNELTAQMYINQALTAHPPCTSAEEALRTTCRRGCLEGGCWLLADEETFEYFFRFTFI